MKHCSFLENPRVGSASFLTNRLENTRPLPCCPAEPSDPV